MDPIQLPCSSVYSSSKVHPSGLSGLSSQSVRLGSVKEDQELAYPKAKQPMLAEKVIR